MAFTIPSPSRSKRLETLEEHVGEHRDNQTLCSTVRRTVRALGFIMLVGCTTHYIGPGRVLGPDWQRSRDPDPTADPTKEITSNPWAPEHEVGQPAATPASRQEYAVRGIATVLGFLVGGLVPLLVWSGTFDENRLAPRRGADDEPEEP